MMSLELFQIYHLKEMSLSAELFLSCSLLQFTFYAISTAYQRKAGFIILNKQVYYIGTLLVILSFFLILNEDLLIMNSFTSNNFIVNDYFGFASKLIICLTSILFLIVINVSFREEPIHNNFEFVILVAISILGLLLLCSSNDLITAYLAIELHSIAFYILAAFKRKSSYSIESGLKYFIIGALSSALFLFGSSIVYGCMGSLSFDDLRMFFSLLSSTKTEIDSSVLLNASKESFQNEFAFGNFETIDNKSLFALITASFASQDLSTVYSLNATSEDNLINWCTKNKFENILLIFPSSLAVSASLANVSDWSSFLIPTQQLEFCSWFLMQSNLDLLVKTNLMSYDNYIWSSLTLFNESELTGGLLLLKYIFIFYLNSENIGAVEALEILNLDLVSIGFLLICTSLFIKLSIAPFHFWSLDVYEGSPNVATFFFAVVPKMALFILLMRICYISFYQIFITNYQMYFFLLAILSVFVGSVGGLEQRKLKTLLAYSSISHTGYLLLSFSTGNVEGMQMMFYYLVIYMVSGLCFWSVYLFLRQKRNFYFSKSNKELGDVVLLSESNPMLALILAITLFSIAGIPPIVGFLAKIGIFLVVVKASIYLIAVLSIVFSVMSTFYYIRLIKILYFENTLVGKLYIPITTQKAILISILSLLLIILCVDPMIIYLLFYKATLLIG